MWKLLIIIFLGLAAGCSDTPQREESAQVKDGSECPAWKILVVEDGRIYCTDPMVLEREREIIEEEEHW